MRVGVVFVHYHTAALLVRAVKSVQQCLTGSGLEAELIIVDNGSDAAERAVLSSLPAVYLNPEANLGYAGGANAGFAKTDAEILFLINPDVQVRPGCLPTLINALQNGTGAAGPRFFWDTARQFLLPPTEERTRANELLKRLASRSDAWAQRARRRWRRHARRHWLTSGRLTTIALSGALLAIRRDALNLVGPFDEEFKLYFEENDWLIRLKRAGLSSAQVADAEAVHLYNQSAVHEPRAARWFAESSLLFETRYYGEWFSKLLRGIPAGVFAGEKPVRLAETPPRLDLPLDRGSGHDELWIEISPSPLGFPAAATRLARDSRAEWRLSDELWDALSPGSYFLRFCGSVGDELALFRFDR